MAITQRPLALRRDLIRIFGEDRLVAVIRTTTPGLARDAVLVADFIKVYAVATSGVPDYITNVRRALTDLPLVATGNIDLEEIPDYFTAGVVGFGVGGPLIRPDLLQRGDVASVIHNAER